VCTFKSWKRAESRKRLPDTSFIDARDRFPPRDFSRPLDRVVKKSANLVMENASMESFLQFVCSDESVVGCSVKKTSREAPVGVKETELSSTRRGGARENEFAIMKRDGGRGTGSSYVVNFST
jgi:hypothetical protein